MADPILRPAKEPPLHQDFNSRWDIPFRHFTPYYAAFAHIYGAFLFCVYFELFGRLLRPGTLVLERVGVIRESILSRVRWPEMVTFEEMNVPVPDPGLIIRALGVVMSKQATSLLDV